MMDGKSPRDLRDHSASTAGVLLVAGRATRRSAPSTRLCLSETVVAAREGERSMSGDAVLGDLHSWARRGAVGAAVGRQKDTDLYSHNRFRSVTPLRMLAPWE